MVSVYNMRGAHNEGAPNFQIGLRTSTFIISRDDNTGEIKFIDKASNSPINIDLDNINLAEYVKGPESVTANNIAIFDSTTGKLIKDSGVSIDDLKMGTGLLPELIITVDTTATITITKGESTFTADTVDNKASFKVPDLGIWNVTATSGEITKSSTIDIETVKIYNVAFYMNFTASLTVSSTQTGATIFVSDGNSTISTVLSETESSAVFDIKSPGTYTVYATHTDETSESVTIDITENGEYSCECVFVHIYGVVWDKSSQTILARTDRAAFFTNPIPAMGTGGGSSPFDDIYPWSGIVRETIGDDEMVKIPKFWVKVINTGSSLTIKIADHELDGFHVSPSHCDRGDGCGERDYIYVSRYHVAASTYRSTTNSTCATGMNISTARSNCIGRGTGYFNYDYLTLLTIWFLYIVEFANWNSQSVIGIGITEQEGASLTGTTDAMTYHTGTIGETRETCAGVQYRYIENLWGNLHCWIDGIQFDSANIYVIKNPVYYSSGTNSQMLSYGRPLYDGYISNLGSDYDNPEYLYPSASTGSGTTYIPDYSQNTANGKFVYGGGGYGLGDNAGLFCIRGVAVTYTTGAYIGIRLIYLPQ